MRRHFFTKIDCCFCTYELYPATLYRINGQVCS